MPEDGVIKFNAKHSDKEPVDGSVIQELNKWRGVLFSKGLVGYDKEEKVGYGNASMRLEPYDADKGKKSFIITGSQTGGLEKLRPEHYCVILEYDPKNNSVVSEGPVKPSSESMTHGAVYDNCDGCMFVFHAHSSEIWSKREELGLPTTDASVEYGTPEIADEVARLFKEKETCVKSKNIFAMAGHEDGVVSFGRTADEAGNVMIEYLERAKGINQ